MANKLFDKNYALAVSKTFTERMQKQHKSIENVANAVGVKYHTLFRYLDGSRQMPIDLFQKLCVYLDLDFAKTFQLVNQIATDTTVNEYQTKYMREE